MTYVRILSPKNTFFLLTLVIIGSCQPAANPCALSKETLDDLNRLDSIIQIPEIIEQDRLWMKENYGEPSIFDAKNESYFLLWDSAFDGAETYRIEKKGSDYLAIKKVFSNRNDTIGVTKNLPFSEADWVHLTTELAAKGFWSYKPNIDRQGLDGATWRIAAYKPIKDECTQRNLHAVSRWSPEDTTFIEMGKLFFELDEE